MRKIYLTFIIIVCLVITGCVKNQPKKEILSYEKAEDICKKTFENGKIVKSYLNTSDLEKNVYEIEILGNEKLYSCWIDAIDGEVLNNDTSLIVNTSTDYNEAMDSAINEVKATLVLKVTAKNDEFKFILQNDKYHYKVVVKDNEVISSEQEPIKIR